LKEKVERLQQEARAFLEDKDKFIGGWRLDRLDILKRLTHARRKLFHEQVTHNWGGVVGGIFDDHALGVWYTGSRWAIFHEDLTAIPVNAMYNVVVGDGFVHHATAANTSSYITTIDNPYANGNPGAILIVTPNWNPGGGFGVYNDHPISVWYDGSHWTIYNEDFAAIPANAAFNVEVSPFGSFVHVAMSTTGDASYFTNPLAAPAGAHAVITHNFGPHFVYDTKHTGVYYGIGTWAVFLEDRTAMIPNAAFDVFIANAPRTTWWPTSSPTARATTWRSPASRCTTRRRRGTSWTWSARA
jgi:hypothetical protein